MKKIAIENSNVVLTPNGAWSWASGRELKIPVTGSTAPFTVNGEPVLLEKNVVDVLRASVPKTYRHCDAADQVGIASVGKVDVNDDSLTQKSKATKSKLVTSETNGGFSILVSKPSSVNGVPDPITQHEGSWRIEDARQAICTEGAVLSSSGFGNRTSVESMATNRGEESNDQARDEFDRVRIWMKAFIPNEENQYVRRIDGENRWVIEFGDTCAETDHRGFSNDPKAEARVTTDFTLCFDGSNAKVEPSGAVAHQPGTSRIVNCKTGVIEKEAPGKFLTRDLEKPRVSDGKVEIKGSVSIRTTHSPIPVPGSEYLLPAVDYSFDITYAKTGNKLKFCFEIGIFPAFEAYVSLNDSAAQKILTVPADGGPWELFDLWVGRNMKRFCDEMTLKSLRDGRGRILGPRVRKRSDVKGES